MKSKCRLENSAPGGGRVHTRRRFQAVRDDKKWAHLDIAGVDCFENRQPRRRRSARSASRLLTTFSIDLAAEKKKVISVD
jgi:hypothetical protein